MDLYTAVKRSTLLLAALGILRPCVPAGAQDRAASVDSGVPPQIVAFLRAQRLPKQQRPSVLLSVPEHELVLFRVRYGGGEGWDVLPELTGLALGQKVGWIADSATAGRFDVERSDRYLFSDEFLRRVRESRSPIDWYDVLSFVLRDPDTPDAFIARVIRALSARTDERLAGIVLEVPRVRTRRRFVEMLVTLPDSSAVRRYEGVRATARRWLPKFAAEIAADSTASEEVLYQLAQQLVHRGSEYPREMRLLLRHPATRRSERMQLALGGQADEHSGNPLEDSSVSAAARWMLVESPRTSDSALVRISSGVSWYGEAMASALLARALQRHSVPLLVALASQAHRFDSVRAAARDAAIREPATTTAQLEALLPAYARPGSVISLESARRALEHPNARGSVLIPLRLRLIRFAAGGADHAEARAFHRLIRARLEAMARDPRTPAAQLRQLAGEAPAGTPDELGDWLLENQSVRGDTAMLALLARRNTRMGTGPDPYRPTAARADSLLRCMERRPSGGECMLPPAPPPPSYPACTPPTLHTGRWQTVQTGHGLSFRVPSGPATPEHSPATVNSTWRGWRMPLGELSYQSEMVAVRDRVQCQTEIGGRVALLLEPPDYGPKKSAIFAYWPEERFEIQVYGKGAAADTLRAILWSVRVEP